MRVEAVKPIECQYDLDGSSVYAKKTGKTADVSFQEILIDIIIEDLREEMHKCISLYGANNIMTLRMSQELDKALNKKSSYEKSRKQLNKNSQSLL